MSTTDYYTPIGGLGLDHLGALAETSATPTTTLAPSKPPVIAYIWWGASAISGGASAYHGYRRHRGSLGWAIGWGLLGSIFPIITPAIALAQGFGKPMVQRNRRRRRSTRRTRRRTSRRSR